MLTIIDALIRLLGLAEKNDSTETKKDTARFVRECLPEIKKELGN